MYGGGGLVFGAPRGGGGGGGEYTYVYLGVNGEGT